MLGKTQHKALWLLALYRLHTTLPYKIKPNIQDSATNCSTTSTGTIAEKIPSSESSRFTPANKSRNGRLSVCLAIVLLLSGFSSYLQRTEDCSLSHQNTGRLQIFSSFQSLSSFRSSPEILQSAAFYFHPVAKRTCHHILPRLSAGISIHINPYDLSFRKRCAIMSEISPVPEPMSRIRLPPCAHAPSKTPSVPTFMAQRSCSISNCLNRKLPINSSVSLQKKTNAPPIYFIASSRNCHFHLQKQLLTSIKTGTNI